MDIQIRYWHYCKSLFMAFALLFLPVYGLANSASTVINMEGQWYKQIDLAGVNAELLGANVGDTVTITSPLNTMITSTWGTMTLTHCSTENKEDHALTTCTLEYIGTYTNTLSISVSAVGFAGTTAQGSLVVGQVEDTSSANILLQLPQKPDYVTGSTLAKVTVKRDNTAVASIDNIPWGGQTTIPVSFVGSMASFNVSVEPLEGGQGIATPSSFSLTDGQTKQVSIYYEAPPERVYGSLNVNVSTIGSIPTTMPSYTVTNTQGETVLSGSLHQGDNNLGQLLSSEGGLSYTLYVPDFIENGNRYTVQGGNTRYFVIQPNQTTSLSLIYDRQAISQDKPYPLQSLENQYNNWLLVNTGSEGLIKGGYQAYTSEGIAFQVLIGAGMLVLDPDNAKAKTSIQAVYDFIYSQGNSRLVNGLLPWAFDDNLNVLEEYSATDADIMLARGFYLAGEVLDNQAYKAAALDMMEAIYEYDTTNLNGAVFLNQGGRNAGSDRNKPVDGIAGMAYSKTLLSSLDEFSKVDTDRSSQWQSVIQNTLNIMRVAQLTAMSNNSNWGGVLGFIRQGVPGAAYFRYENSNFLLNITGDASLNTFDHWNFNYDVGRIPLITHR